MGRKFGFSWSAKRALGISSAKAKVARLTGIPTTRSGRQRKIGRMMGVLGWGLLLGGGPRAKAREEESTGSVLLGCLVALVAVPVMGIGLCCGVVWLGTTLQRFGESSARPLPEEAATLTPAAEEEMAAGETISDETPAPPSEDQADAVRQWHYADGRPLGPARLVKRYGPFVLIEHEPGRSATARVDELSDADQQFLADK